MRLECSVFVGLRRQSGDCKCGRPSRGYLGIGKSKWLKDGDVLHFYLLVQYQSKKPEKFKITKESVQSVLKGQTKAGKATILMNAPPVNIFISEADANKLSLFLASFTQVLEKNTLDERHSLQSWEASSSQSEIASTSVRKMQVTNRADYPTVGFPSSLRELRLNGLRLKSVDLRWFSLRQLTTLDLSVNRLGAMRDAIEWRKFESIRKLERLQELNLSENGLSAFTEEFYDALPTSLVSLNLSMNQFQRLPEKVSHLKNLRVLLLNYNFLTELPEDLCLLEELRVLSVADNRLESLPAPLFCRRNYQRFQRLDLSGNPRLLSSPAHRRRLLGFKEVPELGKIAASTLLNSRVSLEADVLPREVSSSMRDWLRRCSICFRLFPRCDVSDASDIVHVKMSQFAFDTFSGQADLHIERFKCTKCTK